MKVGEPIFAPKRQADKVRACLFIYDKLRYIVYWPDEIKKSLMEVKKERIFFVNLLNRKILLL